MKRWTERLQVMLSPTLMSAFRSLARSKGMHPSELGRQLIAEAIEKEYEAAPDPKIVQ